MAGQKDIESAYEPDISATYREARKITCRYGRIKRRLRAYEPDISANAKEDAENQMLLWQDNKV